MRDINIIDGVMTFNLDYRKRHCWEQKDGTYRFDGNSDRLCEKFREHPKLAGKSEYMRFIHNFSDPVFVTPPLKLGESTMLDGTHRYCENYNDRIKGFLDTDEGVATVEVWDSSLFDATRKALDAVDEEYNNL